MRHFQWNFLLCGWATLAFLTCESSLALDDLGKHGAALCVDDKATFLTTENTAQDTVALIVCYECVDERLLVVHTNVAGLESDEDVVCSIASACLEFDDGNDLGWHLD